MAFQRGERSVVERCVRELVFPHDYPPASSESDGVTLVLFVSPATDLEERLCGVEIRECVLTKPLTFVTHEVWELQFGGDLVCVLSGAFVLIFLTSIVIFRS
jgi:hypothetical protein